MKARLNLDRIWQRLMGWIRTGGKKEKHLTERGQAPSQLQGFLSLSCGMQGP